MIPIKLIGEMAFDKTWKLIHSKSPYEVWEQCEHAYINLVNRETLEISEYFADDLPDLLRELIL